jgi:O-antigen ligase
MASLSLAQAVGKAPSCGDLSGPRKLLPRFERVRWPIRYTFYAFIFSLPFEEADVSIGVTLPKLFGLALAVLALLQPRVCYKPPPRAFWCFGIYLSIFVLSGAYLILVPPNVPEFSSSVIRLLVTLTQLLMLFWLSYNLMQQDRVVNGALWALAVATIVLAVLQVLGVTGDIRRDDRMSAFDADPNGLATVLSLGLLALYGLAYGRETHDWKNRIVFWLCSGILALAVVRTGSRGAVVAVVAALSFFFLRGKSLATKVKLGLIAFAGIIVLAWASYQVEAVRLRWEKTFYDHSTSGREIIYAETIGMILESPLIGWGPVNHLWELGPRVGWPYRDEHNVYLWILAEVGIVGATPFFIGLWLCLRAAWRVRHGLRGVLPLVMLLFILAASMNVTLHKRKYYWVVLSYALAASSYMVRPYRSRIALSSTYPGSGAMRPRYQVAAVSGTGRPRRNSRPVRHR